MARRLRLPPVAVRGAGSVLQIESPIQQLQVMIEMRRLEDLIPSIYIYIYISQLLENSLSITSSKRKVLKQQMLG